MFDAQEKNVSSGLSEPIHGRVYSDGLGLPMLCREFGRSSPDCGDGIGRVYAPHRIGSFPQGVGNRSGLRRFHFRIKHTFKKSVVEGWNHQCSLGAQNLEYRVDHGVRSSVDSAEPGEGAVHDQIPGAVQTCLTKVGDEIFLAEESLHQQPGFLLAQLSCNKWTKFETRFETRRRFALPRQARFAPLSSEWVYSEDKFYRIEKTAPIHVVTLSRTWLSNLVFCTTLNPSPR